MIEAHVGATLANKASEQQLQHLKKLVLQMEQAVEVVDETTYYRLNIEFHEAMVFCTGNKKLISMYRKLTQELSLFRRRNFSDHALLVTSVDEHRDILEAIESRNAAKASEALQRHVLKSRERTLQNYEKYASRTTR
jgi:DNA-binding GntR family transcriptional regulator